MGIVFGLSRRPQDVTNVLTRQGQKGLSLKRRQDPRRGCSGDVWLRDKGCGQPLEAGKAGKWTLT